MTSFENEIYQPISNDKKIVSLKNRRHNLEGRNFIEYKIDKMWHGDSKGTATIFCTMQ